MTKSTGKAIEVEGLRELVRDLRRVGDKDAIRAVKLANRDGAEVVADQAKVEVPRRTGTLAGTIRAGSSQRAGIVRAGKAAVPYAGVIHFGWPERNIAPQPFVYEAMDSRADEVFDLYAERIGHVVNGIGGA